MNLQAISQLNEAQVQDLQRLYQSAWWSKERQLDEIRRMLAGSDIIVGECQAETGRLVSFARVLTDFVYRALILDSGMQTNAVRSFVLLASEIKLHYAPPLLRLTAPDRHPLRARGRVHPRFSQTLSSQPR